MTSPQFKAAELPLDEALAIWARCEHLPAARLMEPEMVRVRAKAWGVISECAEAAIERLAARAADKADV